MLLCPLYLEVQYFPIRYSQVLVLVKKDVLRGFSELMFLSWNVAVCLCPTSYSWECCHLAQTGSEYQFLSKPLRHLCPFCLKQISRTFTQQRVNQDEKNTTLVIHKMMLLLDSDVNCMGQCDHCGRRDKWCCVDMIQWAFLLRQWTKPPIVHQQSHKDGSG